MEQKNHESWPSPARLLPDAQGADLNKPRTNLPLEFLQWAGSVGMPRRRNRIRLQAVAESMEVLHE